MSLSLRVASYLKHLFAKNPDGLTLDEITDGVIGLEHDATGRPREDEESALYDITKAMGFVEKPYHEWYDVTQSRDMGRGKPFSDWKYKDGRYGELRRLCP